MKPRKRGRSRRMMWGTFTKGVYHLAYHDQSIGGILASGADEGQAPVGGDRRFWSLWEMLSLKASRFVSSVGTLQRITTLLERAKTDGDSTLRRPLADKTRRKAITHLQCLAEDAVTLEAPVTADAIEITLKKLAKRGMTSEQLATAQADILSRLQSELKNKKFYYIQIPLTKLYEPGAPLFGPEAEAKFPQMSEDIQEAGRCLGLERSTAAVFHLMRVMELALQRFGTELGVTLVNEKNWQNILDETNKAIGRLNHRLPRTKAFAEAASHLYNVKVAWRNEVMHPKQTYTQEEASAIFSNARTFVRDLAGLI